MKKRFSYDITFDLIVGDTIYECHKEDWLSNIQLRVGENLSMDDRELEKLRVKEIVWYVGNYQFGRAYVELDPVRVDQPASNWQYLIDGGIIDSVHPDLPLDEDDDDNLSWKEQLYKAAGSTPPDDASALHEAYMEEREKVEWGPQEEPDSWGSWGEPVWRDYLECSALHDADIEKKAKAERGRRLLASADKVIATAAIHEEVLRKKHLGAV